MRKIAFWLPILLATSGIPPALADEPAEPNTGAIPAHFLSAANNNSTLVKGSIGNIYSIVAINTTTTLYYLKLYDLAVAPTCGTSIPVQTYPVPFGAANAGGGLVLSLSHGMQFYKGIGFCLVANLVDSDNTSAATGVAINFVYK